MLGNEYLYGIHSQRVEPAKLLLIDFVGCINLNQQDGLPLFI